MNKNYVVISTLRTPEYCGDEHIVMELGSYTNFKNAIELMKKDIKSEIALNWMIDTTDIHSDIFDKLQDVADRYTANDENGTPYIPRSNLSECDTKLREVLCELVDMTEFVKIADDIMAKTDGTNNFIRINDANNDPSITIMVNEESGLAYLDMTETIITWRIESFESNEDHPTDVEKMITLSEVMETLAHNTATVTLTEHHPMTIEEAIAHAEEVVNSMECESCKQEHQQLADWLKELRDLKTKDTMVYTVMYMNPENGYAHLIGVYETYQDALDGMYINVMEELRSILSDNEIVEVEQKIESGYTYVGTNDVSITYYEDEGTVNITHTNGYDGRWSIQSDMITKNGGTHNA